MKTVEQFKEDSKAGGLRINIKAIDDALGAFQKRVTGLRTKNGWVEALSLLRALYGECVRYEGQWPTSARLPAVKRLKTQIAADEPFLVAMAEYENAGNPDDEWDRLAYAQEVYLATRKLGATDRGISDILSGFMATNDNETTASKVILSDFAELAKIRDNPQTPSVLKSVLKEIVRDSAVQECALKLANPSFSYQVSTTAVKTYSLRHQANQALGRKFRLGSLAHELTHVSVAQKFGNTIIMLAAPVGASDDELKSIVSSRRNVIGSVKALVEQAPVAVQGQYNPAALTDEQKKELKGKLEYVVGQEGRNQMQSYLEKLGGYHQAKAATAKSKEYHAQVTDQVKRLLTWGMNAELVEYDSVMNQTMLWCHLWGLPPDNPVYSAITDAARAATGRRLLAKMLVKASNPVKMH